MFRNCGNSTFRSTPEPPGEPLAPLRRASESRITDKRGARMYQDDEIAAAYAADPEGTTERLIQRAAAVAKEEILKAQEYRSQAQFEQVSKGLVETAGAAALNSLEEKYGRDALSRYMPAIGQRLSDHPLPPEVLTSPIQLSRALDEALVLVRDAVDQAAAADHWNGVVRVAKDRPDGRVYL